MLARIRHTDDESSLNRFWLPGAFGSLANRRIRCRSAPLLFQHRL